MEWPKVSIIIPNYNTKHFLESCLRTVLNTDYPDFEVIVVDNASTDGSVELIENMFGFDRRLKIIRNTENLGHAEGCNIGVKKAKGEYLSFLDSDTEVDPNWLRELVKVLRSSPKIGVAQSKLLLEDRHTIWAIGEWIDHFGLGFLEGFGEEDRGQYQCIKKIFNAISAAMAVKRKVFEGVAGFDLNFFIYHDDVDLGWRVHAKGYDIVSVPTSIVYHKVKIGGVLKKPLTKTTLIFHSIKNTLLLLLKNYEFINLCRYFPLNVIYHILRAVAKPECRLACLKAFLWILFRFKTIWRERIKVQHSIRKMPDYYVMQHMLKVKVFPTYVRWFLLHRKHSKLLRFLAKAMI